MFFVARSAVCIALVVGALPNTPPAGRATAPASPVAAGTGVAVLDQLCRDRPARCLAVLGNAMAASRDTLLASDRQPRWAGPALLVQR